MDSYSTVRMYEVAVYVIERRIAHIIVPAFDELSARKKAETQPIECSWPCRQTRQIDRVEELTSFTLGEAACDE